MVSFHIIEDRNRGHATANPPPSTEQRVGAIAGLGEGDANMDANDLAFAEHHNPTRAPTRADAVGFRYKPGAKRGRRMGRRR